MHLQMIHIAVCPRFSILWLMLIQLSLMLWLLNHSLVLHLMPECRKWYYQASRFQNPPPRGRGIMAPEVLQLPTFIGSVFVMCRLCL